MCLCGNFGIRHEGYNPVYLSKSVSPGRTGNTGVFTYTMPISEIVPNPFVTNNTSAFSLGMKLKYLVSYAHFM